MPSFFRLSEISVLYKKEKKQNFIEEINPPQGSKNIISAGPERWRRGLRRLRCN